MANKDLRDWIAGIEKAGEPILNIGGKRSRVIEAVDAQPQIDSQPSNPWFFNPQCAGRTQRRRRGVEQ